MSALHRNPTQKDVAELAGVSTATVSRVLNNQQPLTDAAIERVLSAIQQLNYIPHASARALARNRSGTLGAIIPTLNNAIFAEGINAFEAAAQQQGFTLLLSVSQQNLDYEKALVLKMIERGVDGLLLVGNTHHASVFERLQQSGIQHVCTWAFDQRAQAANIGFDNARAMHDVVDHLVELGHKRFAMLAGCSEDNDRALARLEGVQNRLKKHGLYLEEKYISQVPYTIAESRMAFNKINIDEVSALICGNDVIAFGALLEAQKQGIPVPEKLSITGFDDLSLARELNPALTTVAVSAGEMGQTAAEHLIKAVEFGEDVKSRQVSTQLIIRGTTRHVNRGV